MLFVNFRYLIECGSRRLSEHIVNYLQVQFSLGSTLQCHHTWLLEDALYRAELCESTLLLISHASYFFDLVVIRLKFGYRTVRCRLHYFKLGVNLPVLLVNPFELQLILDKVHRLWPAAERLRWSPPIERGVTDVRGNRRSLGQVGIIMLLVSHVAPSNRNRADCIAPDVLPVVAL